MEQRKRDGINGGKHSEHAHACSFERAIHQVRSTLQNLLAKYPKENLGISLQ
jgi:hypothetical protein